MKFMTCLLMVLTVVGCAHVGSNTTAPGGMLQNLLSENDSNYHFRKVRWGFSKERVELAEAGNPVHKRLGNAIVYKVRINEVHCKLIYTFKDNKLRAAGYLTDEPGMRADNLIKEAVDKHGVATNVNGNEMVWLNSDTVIFANVYTSVTKLTPKKYESREGDGLFRYLPRQAPRSPDRAGNIEYSDGVLAYVDKDFFNELPEQRFPLDDLSFYEKQLMGVIERAKRIVIPGLGTIPQ